MAQALCVPETEHTYEDLMLSVVAQKLKMVSIYLLTHFQHSVNEAERYSTEQYSEVSTVSAQKGWNFGRLKNGASRVNGFDLRDLNIDKCGHCVCEWQNSTASFMVEMGKLKKVGFYPNCTTNSFSLF